MFELSRNLASAAIVCLALCGLVTRLDALRCRDGIENSIGYVYSTDTCAASQTACFQSVKCYKIGDVAYKDYNWACIEGSKCSNSTGKYIASYKGVKGTCCFTSSCNAYKGPCTDAGAGLTATWITIALAAALGYAMF